MTTTTRARKSAEMPKRKDDGENKRPRRATLYLFGAALVVTAIVVAIVLALTGGNDTSGPAAAGPPLELSLGEGDALASCLPLQADILAGMSPAFMATATAVDGESVTLDVDRWYTDGDAQVVNLQATSGMESLIAGFDFEVGEQYLITATDGIVNFCGYSGSATPELTAVFEQAFPA